MSLHNLKIGCLGGGAMAEALLSGLIKSGLAPGSLYVSDIRRERLDYLSSVLKINTVEDNCLLAAQADILIIAVKPSVVGGVMAEISGSLAAGCTLMSPFGVIRVMPNTPCLVGEGACAVSSGTYATAADRERAAAVFSAVGRTAEAPEELMDAVTGLSGSGPAYMFLILEALCDAGVRAGMSRDVSLLLSAQTMLGAAKMVLEKSEHPAVLKNMVTSPAGTTAEGLLALEKRGLRYALMKAVDKAARRSKEISGSLK